MGYRTNTAIAHAAKIFDTTPRDIIERSRHRHIVNARHAVCHVLYETCGMHLNGIAREIQRDHATVYNSVKRSRILADFQPVYRENLAKLTKLMEDFSYA